MKHIIVLLFIIIVSAAHAEEVINISEDGFPMGQIIPEGTACEAIRAYINSDYELWLSLLVRPIYGDKRNEEYVEFKKMMVDKKKLNAKDPNFPQMKIIKVYKARQFSMNGPGSMAYAMDKFLGNVFVDIIVDLGNGDIQKVRYQVLLDQDKKWYFNPRPDLSPLYSMGLNEESESTEEWKK